MSFSELMIIWASAASDVDQSVRIMETHFSETEREPPIVPKG